MNPLDWLAGYKTYLAGVGLIGLGLYQISQEHYAEGAASISAGFGLLFARRASARPDPVPQQEEVLRPRLYQPPK